MTLLTGSLGYGAYALSDDAAAIVAQLPEAAQRLRETMRPQRGEPGTIQQVQQAAEELQQTADEAAGRNPAPRGVQRVQIEEPTINVRAVPVVGIGRRSSRLPGRRCSWSSSSSSCWRRATCSSASW